MQSARSDDRGVGRDRSEARAPGRQRGPEWAYVPTGRSKTGEFLLYVVLAAMTTGVFIADLATPLGIGIWVLYSVPVVLTYFFWSASVPIIVAVVMTVIMLVGYLLSPLGTTSAIVAQLNRGFGGVTIWTLAMVGHFFIKNKLVVRREEWLQAARTRLSEAIVGEKPFGDLGSGVLQFLSSSIDVLVGAFFVGNRTEYRRVATFGVPANAGLPETFGPDDGLLGQVVKNHRTFLLDDVPDGYLTVGSAFGNSKPRHLLIAPMTADGAVEGVIELGFLHPPQDAVIELIARISESVGVAIRSAKFRTELRSLLEETQRQAETLQVQSEELRVSNEELEEQSRALQESQARLEQQQEELEQTNAQLEEQAQLLETQRDDLARARSAMEVQTRELEQASRYKSDFLANMSHELRTPLNSSLILAKLLADNPKGNLDDEQIKYARTIQSAGNDLLDLINDILDLSKIEAGHMELRPEAVDLSRLIDGLARTFEPMAGQKALEFRTHLDPACALTIETDRLRLEQVLKNLLSNAIKFTERGSVTLNVAPAPGHRLAISVTDTGIGIPEHQREVIFQAFRQADGTTNRKYGGTGLGLSISRELTRLLGGEIRLESEMGRGSTFTVNLPREIGRLPSSLPTPAPSQPAQVAFAPSAQFTATAAATTAAPTASGPRITDDREQLSANRRVILVVEDDEHFAGILSSLTRELGFQSLVASTAEEAIEVASRYLPSAVILDVGLPDHSGLSVLDRLKHDARTRHIPVHVVSGTDYTQTALSLGAASYLIKPVRREQLVEELQGIERRLSQRMRRVLLVEDDPVQLESLQKLLGSQEVETVGVSSASSCLAKLREETFDCMVLDLSLPDASGYDLLETLSREDAYSFPPAIVYTGRDLSADEEDRLRRYSKSIIIKGAKSPERLLDEVTLFLHQVVSDLTPEQQRMLERARSRDAALEGRRILVVEDDVRNVFALTSVLEPRGAQVQIARNGIEAIETLERSADDPTCAIDLVLMDVMMPEMDGITATQEIRSRPEWQKLPIIMLTAKAMKDDQERCLEAGANDYMAKPLDVAKLLSLVRVWMPR